MESIIAQQDYDNTNLNKKDEIVPENISKKMADAISAFRERYIVTNKNKEGFLDVLSSITIF